MRPVSVSIENFLCIEKLDIEFPRTGCVLVTAADPERSNGVGKSAIFEALYWSLSGKTVRGARAGGVVRASAKGCRVRAVWEVRGREITIVRERGRSPKLTVDGLPEQHTARDAQDALEAFLREVGVRDLDVLGRVLWCGRRYPSLVRDLPSARAAVVETVADVALLDEWRRRARQLHQHHRDAAEQARLQLERLKELSVAVDVPPEPEAPDCPRPRELRRRLQNLDAALQRCLAVKERLIERVEELAREAETGTCRACGQPLPAARLEELEREAADVCATIEAGDRELQQLRQQRQAAAELLDRAEREWSEYDRLRAAYEAALRARRRQEEAARASIEACEEDLSRHADAAELAGWWADALVEVRARAGRAWCRVVSDLAGYYAERLGAHRPVLLWEGKGVDVIVQHAQGMEVSPDVLSDGELQRADLCVALALADLVRSAWGLVPALRVFDEPLSGLDAAGREAVFELLTEAAQDDLVVVVDHDAAFAERFDRRLLLHREPGEPLRQDGAVWT